MEESIDIMVRQTLVQQVAAAKYSSVSVRSTPALTHVDRLRVFVRCCLNGEVVERSYFNQISCHNLQTPWGPRWLDAHDPFWPYSRGVSWPIWSLYNLNQKSGSSPSLNNVSVLSRVSYTSWNSLMNNSLMKVIRHLFSLWAQCLLLLVRPHKPTWSPSKDCWSDRTATWRSYQKAGQKGNTQIL